MKKIFTLLMALAFAGFSFAQSIIDFETVGQDWSWTIFENGDNAASLYSVVDNPDNTGVNTSTKAGKYIVNASAQPWAGLWSANLGSVTFSADNCIVKVMVFKNVVSDFDVKFENDNASVAFEIKVANTLTGEWEELIFDFSAQIGKTVTKIVIFPDFPTARTAGSTNYFDNISFNALTEPPVELPTLPIDFETGTFSFIDFDGGAATVIANPQSSGINTSAKVAQIIRNGGASWGGSKLILNSKIDFSSAATISMKVYSTRAGVPVLFKLEGDAGAQAELSVNTTVANAWETLEWDFTGQPSNTFNNLVFMFDFGVVGDGSANSTFLFDDIEQIDNTGGLSQIDLPVDFESTTVNYAMTDFGGNVSSLVEDPTDASNTVAKVIKTAGAETWAGTTIGTALGFANPLPLTSTVTKVSVRVYSPTAGIQVRLKAEDHNNVTLTVETEATTTIANDWEELVFDFSNVATGTNPYNSATNFDKVSIFFSFGVVGSDKVYYFDNVKMYGDPLGFDKLNQIDFQVYPNPASDYLYISNSSDLKRVEIYTITGQKLRSLEFISNKIQIAELPQGVYLLSAETNSEEIVTTKFFKY
ncbi:MAG TPA: hypothetical protein DCG69_03275 [Bacteroidales bacterium]|nr:hypothetical protein [Bacteroidales bacterium]